MFVAKDTCEANLFLILTHFPSHLPPPEPEMKFITTAILATLAMSATATVAHKHPHQMLRKQEAVRDAVRSHHTITHFPEGRLDSTLGKRSLAEVNVAGMDELFNTVSNDEGKNADYTGNSLMANGDTTLLAVGSFKCSDGTNVCANSDTMLSTVDLNGEVECVEDNASCVLDGENARRGMLVWGTGSGTLTLRALTFDKGSAQYGGGIVIEGGAVVAIVLCVFSTNTATGSKSDDGGGAMCVYGTGTKVDIYGTSFIGNTDQNSKHNGKDIYNPDGRTITIHNTCPSPYSSNTPIQGKTRMRVV
jgi:hypothetical protein